MIDYFLIRCLWDFPLALSTHQFFYTSKLVWSWLYSSDGSEEMGVSTFIHTSWTLQYVSEGILLSRLLEGLICDPCIQGRDLDLETTVLPVVFLLKSNYISVFWWSHLDNLKDSFLSLISVVSKAFKKLAMNGLADHLKKCFFWFLVWF